MFSLGGGGSNNGLLTSLCLGPYDLIGFSFIKLFLPIVAMSMLMLLVAPGHFVLVRFRALKEFDIRRYGRSAIAVLMLTHSTWLQLGYDRSGYHYALASCMLSCLGWCV